MYCTELTERQDDVLILSDLTMLPSRKKNTATPTQSWKPLQKYFTYQQVHNDTANKPDYLFTNYRQLCLFANYGTAGFKVTHHGGVTLVVSMCLLLVLLLHYYQANQEG